MCGIVGYIGDENATDIIIDGLKRLEYRGYDSAGIALCTKDGLEVRKKKGRIQNLEDAISGESLYATLGIGHTRWATHGGVNDCNAHPHQVGKVTLVHNGIIENYRELIADYDLADTLKSETDSEVWQRF